MHTMQLVLIECIGKETPDISDLVDEVQMNFDTGDNNHWWDWWQIGGRWESYLKEQISSMIWPESLESPVALRLTKENKPMALKLLKLAQEQQVTYLLNHVNTLKELGVDLNDYILNLNSEYNNWEIPGAIRSIFSLKNGDWSWESGFVDYSRWGSSKIGDLINYLEEKENTTNYWDSGIENYVLVVVDFHF